jgi:hypothetical protein
MTSLKFTDKDGKETSLDLTNKASNRSFEKFMIDNINEHLEDKVPYNSRILKELGYSDERIKELGY